MKGFYQQTISILFVCLFISGIESCRNCKPPKYYLSDYSKTWIGYAGNTVIFKNDTGDSAIYTYSKTENEFVRSDFRGEECGDIDDLETVSFDLLGPQFTFGFNFSLSTSAYEAEHLQVSYLDYLNVPNGFYFSFSFQNDTVVSSPEFFDQLDLNGFSFQNVYHSTCNSSSVKVTDCYFTKELGFVGFKTTDGRTWALQ